MCFAPRRVPSSAEELEVRPRLEYRIRSFLCLAHLQECTEANSILWWLDYLCAGRQCTHGARAARELVRTSSNSTHQRRSLYIHHICPAQPTECGSWDLSRKISSIRRQSAFVSTTYDSIEVAIARENLGRRQYGIRHQHVFQ